MKNKFSVGIILSVVFFLSTKLYAVDFKTKNESQLFTSYGTKRVYSNDIDEGEKLQVDSTTIYYRISNWDYAVKIIYKYAYYFTDLDNLVPYKESDLFANDILSSSGEIVAYSGQSGANKDGTINETRWDPHLHLSYYEYKYRINNSIATNSGENCIYSKDYKDIVKTLNNPFIHNDIERKPYKFL